MSFELSDEQLAEKLVRSLVKHGFMSGWFGDKSEEFIAEQTAQYVEFLQGRKKIATGMLRSHLGNLRTYCGWTADDLTLIEHRLS